MNPELIYDVGVNDGADTAFYLSLGYRVIGIEANPVLADPLRDKFAAEIDAGRFTLLNIGVAATEGELEFWLSDHAEWSSFSREIASRNATTHRAVMVPTRLFADIVDEYGVPYYCKIDIEGNDSLCLMGLTPETAPPYISIEMSHAQAGADLELLRDLRYDKFKVISQRTRTQPTRLEAWLGYALPPKWSRRVRLRIRNWFGVHSVGAWKFAANSSGPFAEKTPGRWRSYGATVRMWRFLRDVDRRYSKEGVGDWFDIHACKAIPRGEG